MTKRRAAAPSNFSEPLHWSCDVPLLTNRFILWDMLKVLLIAGAVLQGMVLLISFLLGDELMFLPLQLWAILAAILAALFALSAGVVLQNSLAFEYVLDEQGAQGLSRIRRRGSRVALMVLGVLAVFARGPAAAGALSLGSSREGARLPWREVGKVTVHPAQRVISLNDSWHCVLRLYVPAEHWEAVLAHVQAATAKPLAARAARPRRRIAWRSTLLWGGVAVVGTFLSGAWPRLFYDHDERFALLAGVLLLIGGLLGPTARWLLALFGGLSALYFLARLVMLATERMAWRGQSLGYGYSSDSALLALSGLGALALLGLGLYGLLAPRLAQQRRVRAKKPEQPL